MIEYPTFDELIEKTINWADDKELLDSENASKQFMKFIEEAGELAQTIVKQKKAEQIGEMGDVFVTLIILSAQLGAHPTTCLHEAYEKIAKRKGKKVDGIFIKE